MQWKIYLAEKIASIALSILLQIICNSADFILLNSM